MRIDGQHYRTIWMAEDGATVEVIDQTKLPFRFEILPLRTLEARRAPSRRWSCAARRS